MKKITHALLATGLAAAVLTPAQAEISGNISLGTDYIYRGVSQTTGQSAVSGGFDIEGESGFYAGIWASNINFADSVETDYYGGYAGSFSDNLDFDIGLIHYDYIGDSDLDFQEVYFNLSVGALSGGIAYSNDFFGGVDDALYYSVSYGFDLGNDWGLSLNAGLSDFDQDVFGEEDGYTDYGISLSKSWQGVDLSLTLTDTNLSNGDCFDSEDCDSTVTFTVSKSL